MSTLNIGVVGLGTVAPLHFKGFQVNPEANITGMTHILHGNKDNRKRLQQELQDTCREWGIQAYDSFDNMVVDPSLDALIISSINTFHYDQIVAALNNDKHVMVEKPVVTKTKHVDKIKQLADEKGLKIFPSHNYVYRNAIKKAKQVLESVELGGVIQASFICTHSLTEAQTAGWRAKKKLVSGGVLMDKGCHLVYQALYLLGKPIKLHAFTSKRVLKQMEGEDTAQVNLYYPDNSIAMLMQTWAGSAEATINGIHIVGEKNNLVITNACYLNNEKIDSDVEYENSFVNQAKAFTDYILHDVPPLSSIDDVRDTLEIIHHAYKSARSDVVITLAE